MHVVCNKLFIFTGMHVVCNTLLIFTGMHVVSNKLFIFTGMHVVSNKLYSFTGMHAICLVGWIYFDFRHHKLKIVLISMHLFLLENVQTFTERGRHVR